MSQSRGRGGWIFFQALASIALGFFFYSIYQVLDGFFHGAINAWVNSGVTWGLSKIGVSSTMLTALLQGQNLVGTFTTIFALCVFYAATKPRPMAGPR